ncbi:MAG TPA: hypothetical protein VF767_01155 [Bryobacteraceae bacterium]
MRQRVFGILLSVIPACVLAWAGTPELVRFAPLDSGALIGINLEQIRASSLGKTILAKAASDNADLKKFIALAGFDPLRDIDEILIAAPGRNDKARGLFLLRGRFDPTRFAELALQPGMNAGAWHGVQVITKQQEQPVALACLSASLLIGGDLESVRATISRREKGSGPGAELAAKAAGMREANDIWFVSQVPPAGLTGGARASEAAENPQVQLLRSIEQASGGLKFGTNLVLAADLTTHTPQDAQSLTAVMRLFIGLAASNQRDSKQAGAILEKLALKAEGNSVKLAFSLPEAELMKSIEMAINQAQARMSARRESAPPPPPPSKPTEVKIYSSPRDMGVVVLPAPKQ